MFHLLIIVVSRSVLCRHYSTSHSVSTLIPMHSVDYSKRRLPVPWIDTDDDDVISSNSKISLYLRALRDNNNNKTTRMQSDSSNRLTIRDELDSFARTLDDIQVKGHSLNINTDSSRSAAVQSQSDLEQLEILIEKTFGRQGRALNTTTKVRVNISWIFMKVCLTSPLMCMCASHEHRLHARPVFIIKPFQQGFWIQFRLVFKYQANYFYTKWIHIIVLIINLYRPTVIVI